MNLIKKIKLKMIEYINLKNFMTSLFQKKNLMKFIIRIKIFTQIHLKNFKISELKPLALVGTDEYNEAFFDKINEVENSVLDNLTFTDLANKYNLKITTTGMINSNLKNAKELKFSKKLIESLMKIENEEKTNFLNIGQNFYIAKLTEIVKRNKNKDNKDVRDAIKAQVLIERKINGNTKLAKDISIKSFTRSKMDNFAKENNLQIQSKTLNGLNENNIFSKWGF